MGWADTYNLRDKDNCKINDIADAFEALQTASGPLVYTDYSGSITWGGGGSMTVTNPSTEVAEYCQIGELVHFYMYDSTLTIGGTPHATLWCSLPVQPADDYGAMVCWQGSAANLYGQTQNSTTRLNLYKAAYATWSGTPTNIFVNIVYKAA